MTTLFTMSILMSQSAMDLFACLLALTMVVTIVRRQRQGLAISKQLPRTGLEKFWPIWLVAIALSYALSPLTDMSDWPARFLEFRWILFLYVLLWSFQNLSPKPGLQKFAAGFLGFCSLYAIVVWFLGFDPINPGYDLAPWSGGHRTGGFLSNAMTFAHVYGEAYCLAAGLTFTAWMAREKDRGILLAAVVFTAVALVLSFTRGVWIGVGAATLLMAFAIRPKLGAIVAGAGAIALAAAFVLWPAMQNRLMGTLNSGDEREWIWKAHSRIFLEHPFTGVGYGENWRLLDGIYKDIGAPEGVLVSHAHNQYLHFLAGTGILGFLCYAFFQIWFLRTAYLVYASLRGRDFFKEGLALGCLGAQVAFILGGLTESNFEHSKMRYAMIVVWSLVLWLRSEQNGRPSLAAGPVSSKVASTTSLR